MLLPLKIPTPGNTIQITTFCIPHFLSNGNLYEPYKFDVALISFGFGPSFHTSDSQIESVIACCRIRKQNNPYTSIFPEILHPAIHWNLR